MINHVSDDRCFSCENERKENIDDHLYLHFQDNITVENSYGTIVANNVWGALNGLETFSQLFFITENNLVRIFLCFIGFICFTIRFLSFFLARDQFIDSYSRLASFSVSWYFIGYGSSFLARSADQTTSGTILFSSYFLSSVRFLGLVYFRIQWFTTNIIFSIGTLRMINHGLLFLVDFHNWLRK